MIHSQYLKEILACPTCNRELEFREIEISCTTCGVIGKIQDGVLDFSVKHEDRSANTSDKFYNDENYRRGIENQRAKQHLHYNENSLSGRLEQYFKDQLLKIVTLSQRPFFDIGCGSGSGFRHLGYPEEIVGIDLSFNLVKSCKDRFPESDCICCDIIQPPFKKKSMKTVFCLETLEHIFYLERFVEAIEGLLSDDGYFYVLIPNESGFAWSVLRTMAHYKYSREYEVDYKKMFKKVHCNNVHTIDNVLNKFFRVEHTKSIPFRIGGKNLNLVTLYRLRKML